MKSFSLGALLLLGAATLCPAQSASPETDAGRVLVPFTPRSGLPNFFAKAKAGGPLKVAYLGGSITAQKGWRVQSLAWLQKKFPQAQWGGVDAAVGGTGSELGVFRLQADVLDSKPDLLFVEFAVNDALTQPPYIVRAMEGIVRKTWRTLPECDICFVYTITEKDVATLQSGRMTRAQSAMEDVADRYGIPSVSLGEEVARRQKAGTLVMMSPDAHVERVSGDELNQTAQPGAGPMLFSKDGVHPYLDTGHVLYTQALARALGAFEPEGQPGAHVLPSSLAADNWEDAQSVPLDKAGTLTGPVEKLGPSDPMTQAFANRLPGLWKLAPGASLHFRFRGTKACLYALLTPDGGPLDVTLDGKTRRDAAFDAYTTYPRLALLRIGDGLPDAEHDVTVTVVPELLDKRSLLLEARRADFDAAPAKYDGGNWYAGALLLVGTPLP